MLHRWDDEPKRPFRPLVADFAPADDTPKPVPEFYASGWWGCVDEWHEAAK